MNMMTRAPAPPYVDPRDLPAVYASTVAGTCIEPWIFDGETLVFEKDGTPDVGDLVGLWVLPKGSNDPRDAERGVKRLVMGAWEGMVYPYKPHPNSNVAPLIVVEMLNPRRRFHIPCDRILALHRVTGMGEVTAPGMARQIPLRELPELIDQKMIEAFAL